jgi:hypothetical protein
VYCTKDFTASSQGGSAKTAGNTDVQGSFLWSYSSQLCYTLQIFDSVD